MAEIKFKILAKHPDQHSVTVRYYTKKLTEKKLGVEFDPEGNPTRCQTDYNVNIWKVDATPEEIIEIVNAAAPVDWLTLQEKVKDPKVDTSMSAVDDLIGKVFVYKKPTPPQTITITDSTSNTDIKLPEILDEKQIEDFINNMPTQQ
jgi:hypothetical protein